MLTQVTIHNLITIEKLLLEFKTGTTVITGETGTGKSILIDAIELALGARASEQVVGPLGDKTDITLCFDASKLPDARAWLSQYDLSEDTHECMIRRTITADGRSRSYINGMPTTLAPLRALSELLIDIHGQHEYHSLLKMEKQRDILDDFSGHTHLVDQVKAIAEDWRALNQEIISLQKRMIERETQIELLQFQLHELTELNITPDEFQALDLEHKQLAHADELLQNINQSVACLTENEEVNALYLLNQALHALETVSQVDPKITAWIGNIKSAIIEISEVENDLHRYLETITLDPERLIFIEQRISALFNLARKHKISPNELFDFQQNLSKELNEITKSDERLQEFIQKREQLEKNYLNTAKKLSASRKKFAKQLTDDIEGIIHTLGLPHAEFYIEFESENMDFSPHGLERIIFQIKTNKGQTKEALAKIASGGELSRISLAIYIATAKAHTTPTLIFDQVDVGISGGTAEIVGKLLRRLGKTHQLICVTHLPQVAVQGDQHLRVEKITHANSTKTYIKMLSSDEKIKEIARMLGGIEITPKTLAHAEEMLEKVE